VREPESEEDHVIAAVRHPGEKIGLDEAHPVIARPGCRDGEHFRGRVHGGDVRRVTQKPAGPHAGSAGELEHASGRLECLERFGQLAAARKIQALVQVIRGKGPVVGHLLIEEPAEFSAAS
jgi:hypothetical protein